MVFRSKKNGEARRSLESAPSPPESISHPFRGSEEVIPARRSNADTSPQKPSEQQAERSVKVEGARAELASGAEKAKVDAAERAKADAAAKAKAEAAKAEVTEKAKAEAAAKAKAKAEQAVAEATERAAAEEARRAKAAEARAAREVEESAWRAELSKMTSVEAFGAHAAQRLHVDLSGLRQQIDKGERAMAATDAEIAENEKGASESGAAAEAAIAQLQQEAAAVAAVQRLVGTFEAESAGIAKQLELEVERSSHDDAHTRSMRERLEQEKGEASARRAAAEERRAALEGELAALRAGSAPSEAAAEEQLAQLSDEAVALRLKAVLAERMAAVYSAEEERIVDEEGAAKLHAAKKARAEETRGALAELRAQLEADDATMAALGAQEAQVEQAEAEEAARAAQRRAAYASQLQAAKELAARQAAFLDERLAEAQRRAAEAPAEAKLLDETVEYFRQQHAASVAEAADVEAQMAAHEEASAKESGRRALELRQLRAERKAIGVAHEHRQEFAKQRGAQLATEEAEAGAAGGAVAGRGSRLEMMRGELEACRQIQAKLEAQAAAAEGAREDKRRAVAELRATNSAREASLRRRLDCECGVLEQQQRYVASLEAKLREAGLQCAEGEAAEGARGRGESVVAANAAAAKTYVGQLGGRLAKCEEALGAARRARERQAGAAAAEAKRLGEQKASMADALCKLREYEASLASNLSSLSPATSPAKPMTKPAAAAPVAPPSVRHSAMIEVSADAAAPAAPPPIPAAIGEAARLIELVSHDQSERLSTAGLSKAPSAAGLKAERPASPTEVSTRIEAF